jgi:dipeptidyl aminopeptidase/acylaminoacyl peptidase
MVGSGMFLVLLLAIASSAFPQSQMWPVEKLYKRPFVWGTPPSELKWTRTGGTLAFLWNEEGNRFLDLYVWREGKRRRVTSLESMKDDIWLTPADKDSRLASHRPPEAGLSAVALSGDGSRAAFAYRGDVFVAETSGTAPLRRLTRTRAAESAVQISPDGKRVAYLRDRQLFIQDDSGVWQVTDFETAQGQLTSYAWSPDGKRFALITRKGESRALPLPNYSGQFVSAPAIPRTVAGDDPPELTLWIANADGSRLRSMPAPALGRKIWNGDVEWSPTSTHLMWRVQDPLRKKMQIVSYEVASPAATVLAEEHDPAWNFTSAYGWSTDGRSAWFTSDREGFAHIYRVDLPASGAKGEPKQITRGAFETHGSRLFCIEPKWAGEWIHFNSTEDGTNERQFYRIRADGSGKERLSRTEGINCGAASADGSHVAELRATPEQPFDLWVDGQRVTVSPRKEFAGLPWPKTKFVEFPSRGDRAAVRAKILLPPGYDPSSKSGKLWPCVFFIHGAGYATSVLKQWGSYNDVRYVFNAWLANHGYVVMDIDYRGSSGYGRDWRTGVYLHMGGLDLADVLGGVDFLRSLGNIDMKRLGMWGVSYGGFMTAMALFQAPGEFRAGSAWAGVYDWENYNAGYTAERLGTPASYPEAYRRSSPIHFSHGLQDQLQIIHGMVDSNVLFQDAVQLSEKLIQEGKTFEHFYYPEEDHAFVRDETLSDAYRRTADFLLKHLR